MSESKPFASLSARLLARKGGAKPAPPPPAVAAHRDALARGFPSPPPAEKDTAQKDPAQKDPAQKDPAQKDPHGALHRSALADGRRAAFTLRLDAERHRKLRLACAREGRSAQMLLVAALDRLLDTYPPLDTSADKIRQSR